VMTTDRLRHAPVFDVDALEQEVGDVVAHLPRRATQTIIEPMPDYVTHREGITRVGALSAEAVARDYETAAKAIEAMGRELLDMAAKAEAQAAEVNNTITFLNETAALYRDQAKRTFDSIEQCAMMTEAVRKTCTELREKIATAEPIATIATTKT